MKAGHMGEQVGGGSRHSEPLNKSATEPSPWFAVMVGTIVLGALAEVVYVGHCNLRLAMGVAFDYEQAAGFTRRPVS
jgi:hypothetical protein